ncbi:uncharacterized protein PAE49_008603 [Odontesthes bonariensis]
MPQHIKVNTEAFQRLWLSTWHQHTCGVFSRGRPDPHRFQKLWGCVEEEAGRQGGRRKGERERRDRKRSRKYSPPTSHSRRRHRVWRQRAGKSESGEHGASCAACSPTYRNISAGSGSGAVAGSHTRCGSQSVLQIQRSVGAFQVILTQTNGTLKYNCYYSNNNPLLCVLHLPRSTAEDMASVISQQTSTSFQQQHLKIRCHHTTCPQTNMSTRDNQQASPWTTSGLHCFEKIEAIPPVETVDREVCHFSKERHTAVVICSLCSYHPASFHSHGGAAGGQEKQHKPQHQPRLNQTDSNCASAVTSNSTHHKFVVV